MQNDLVITTIAWIKKQGGGSHSISLEAHNFDQAQYNFNSIKRDAEKLLEEEGNKV